MSRDGNKFVVSGAPRPKKAQKNPHYNFTTEQKSEDDLPYVIEITGEGLKRRYKKDGHVEPMTEPEWEPKTPVRRGKRQKSGKSHGQKKKSKKS